MEVLFLVVTMTGTAEMLAEDIIAEYGGGNTFRLQLAERSDPAQLGQISKLVVISSTYGTGDIPDPGKPFFDTLQRTLPDLSHLEYGVISLGDSIYKDTFANGGLLWDALLRQLGAQQLRLPLLLDASAADDMSQQAIEWAGHWLQVAADMERARSA
jgi:MioC protein